MNIRRTAAAGALAAGLIGLSAAGAVAEPSYPPTPPSEEVLGDRLEASAPPAASTGGTEVLGSRLAFTGSEAAALGGAGAVLLVVGAGAVVLGRKRASVQE